MFGSSTKASNVGVIGLGIIGSRVAECLRRADHHVFVWSRTPRPIPNFMASAREIAELATTIQIFVRDAEALLEVMEEMKAALNKQHVVLCHATVGAEAVKQAAKIAEEQGASFLDAPFTGSKLAAEKGELVYYIGGAETDLERVRKVLEASSKKILHFGPIGDATVLKIATNLISGAIVEALAEALAITKAHGVAADKLLEALVPNANCSPLITMKLPAMISGSYEPQFSVSNMLKDNRYAQTLAREKFLHTPVLDSTTQALSRAEQSGHGDRDYSALMENYSASALYERAQETAVKSTPPATTIVTEASLAAPSPLEANVVSPPASPELEAAPVSTEPENAPRPNLEPVIEAKASEVQKAVQKKGKSKGRR